MRAAAQVSRGMRSERDVPIPSVLAEHQPQPAPSIISTRPVEDGERVYHTAHAGLIVQITSPSDRFDPSTGSFIRSHPIKAIFGSVGSGTVGEYRTKDPMIQKELEGNARYGLNLEYWRADIFNTRAREAMKAQVKAQLTGDPALLTEVLQEVASQEFDLPKSVGGADA